MLIRVIIVLKTMLKGIGTFIERKITTRGKKYKQYLIYIPKLVALDSRFPFKPGDKLFIEINGDKLIISKCNGEDLRD